MRNQRESPNRRQRRIALIGRWIDRAVAHLQRDLSLHGDWDRDPERTERMYGFLLHERSYVTAAAQPEHEEGSHDDGGS